ncbi:protein Cep89 homolog [Bacillus rossius redtenbacheri]|uniref:protein Cep89 homolog n=1 Tax=Bacillus rossius redtenbacheri TaxID=93214 RepID=UPI002FDD2B0E
MSVPSLPLFLAETRFRFNEVAQKNCRLDCSEKPTFSSVPSNISHKTSQSKPSGRGQWEAARQSSATKEEASDRVSRGHAHRHHRHKSRRVATMSAGQDNTTQRVQAQKEDLVNGVPISAQMRHSPSSLDSGLQNTPSDEMVHRKDEHIKNLQVKLSALTKKYKDVENERDSLKTQLANLHHKQEALSRENDRVAALEAENREMKGDIVILKNLVYRLNVALEQYQQKYKPGELSFVKPTEVDGKQADLLWSSINKKALFPLLDAYSETIKEKDDLIHSYEIDLNKFVANCKNIVEENEKLHGEVEDLRKKHESRLLELQTAQQEAALAQEQSEVLTDQLQLQNNKLQEISTSCQARIGELLGENDVLKEKYHQCRGDLLAARGQLSVLKEEYENVKKDLENKIPFAVHTAAVSECRRLLDELKLKYESERSQLSSQLAAVQKNYAELQTQHAAERAERKQELIQVPNLEKLLKRSQQQCEDLQRRLVSARVSRDAAKRQLQKAVLFSEELVAEQERLLGRLHAKQQEAQDIARIGSSISSRMNTLRSKIKTVKKFAFKDLHVIENRIKEQESNVDRMKDEYHNEVARLRNLVRHKEAIISRLQQEKCKTEEDLEVVWHAATSQESYIKDKLKRVHILLPGRDPSAHLHTSSQLK